MRCPVYLIVMYNIGGFMSYEEFKQKQDLKNEKARQIAQRRSNQAYNKGLLEGLGFWKAYLYPALKRADT